MAGPRGKLLAWLQTNGPASKTAMKKAGFGWESLTGLLDGLERAGKVETLPGRIANTVVYVVSLDPSSQTQDGSTGSLTDGP